MEEDYRTSSNFHQYINIAEIRVPCAPLTIKCRYYSVIHEFDRAMSFFSIGVAKEFMMNRLISKFGIKRTRSGFSSYIYKLHHGISTDLLEIKWGIVLYKSKRTLQSATQDNVISSLKPLTWWYRTDFLSHRIRQLNCRFYTDTIFSKDKSIVGNTCAHIFTGGYFVEIIPMIYKSEDGTTLDRMNRDVRVANKIFMNNTPKQTGSKTEIKRVKRL